MLEMKDISYTYKGKGNRQILVLFSFKFWRQAGCRNGIPRIRA